MFGLYSFSEDQILDFIATEISKGNKKSQYFCMMWLAAVDNGEHPPARHEKSNAVAARLPEIADVIAENFDKPGVTYLVKQLGSIWFGDVSGKSPLIKSLKKTKVGDKIKGLVKTGTLQQRFDIHRTALEMFADEKDVLEIYEKDLLNPELNNASVTYLGSSDSHSLA